MESGLSEEMQKLQDALDEYSRLAQELKKLIEKRNGGLNA